MPKKNKGPRTNKDITSSKVRLVDGDGEMLGVLPIDIALDKAKLAGLDLVEISPNAEPPVCKMLDYGKYRYEQQRKAKDAKKNQKVTQIKELKMRINIDTHDYDVKMRAANKFLEAKNKVKFSIRFRGREMAHNSIGKELLEKVAEELKEIAKIEVAPKMEGRQMFLIMVPL